MPAYSLAISPLSIPLSLYIHIPWCVRKCPYCDFNSHVSRDKIPEAAYVDALIKDLIHEAARTQKRPLTSIFFGGGTPSLFSAAAIARILTAVQTELSFSPNIEITLEANPGTTEYMDFTVLRATGVNRLSLGVQSFNDQHLQQLGRIHSSNDAKNAFQKARTAGFNNINIDLMHGLPQQTTEQALDDLSIATALNPEHLSWYQLTIEPNTVFFNQPPALPLDDELSDIQDAGEQWLSQNGYQQYEVSAYARNNRRAQHNLNYWQFGDYIGIGAGAHGKITHTNGHIERYRKTRLPADYLNPNKNKTAGTERVEAERLPLEFLMNALRLPEGVSYDIFEARTGLAREQLKNNVEALQAQHLLTPSTTQLATTALGFRFLNTVLNNFSA
ncbi:MAG: radical SAM family heme chaperone HemW [Marinagarivorans sp.]|nr:radical SAM family heme chaperone HemW [Marinagarivorans sp.]